MLSPALPPYDVGWWRSQPFPDRMRLVCQAWAAQGYGSPASVYVLYLLKIAAWIGVWVASCTVGAGQDLANIADWWAGPDAFTRAMLWTTLFEGLGLGCGSGPLTARYVPPIGGALYFLRPGTTKLPLIPGLPVIGGHRRTVLDVALYAATIGWMTWLLVSPVLRPVDLWPILVALPVLGLLDKTLFLVFRSEHYWSSLLMVASGYWIAGNKGVWLAIWLWAATSKVNAHFPAVMCVMTSNAPWTRFGPLRRWVYRDFPNDVRPSRFTAGMAHFGTIAEFVFPLALLAASGTPYVWPFLILSTGFHLFIMSNVPMGVPLEWNVVMIYGAWALFGVHGDVGLLSIDAGWVIAWLLLFHIAVPLYGSQYPDRMSFLLSMRYYAGNWAFSVWLFKPEALAKLDRSVTKWSPLVSDQLRMLYDEDTVTALMSKVMAFRAMHLLGRTLTTLIPKAVDDVDAYEWLDGEVVAGMVVGWNFGEGHLHDTQLLAAVQAQCGFADGDVRCVFVESQPIFGDAVTWRVADAARGVIESGSIPVKSLVEAHPWPV